MARAGSRTLRSIEDARRVLRGIVLGVLASGSAVCPACLCASARLGAACGAGRPCPAGERCGADGVCRADLEAGWTEAGRPPSPDAALCTGGFDGGAVCTAGQTCLYGTCLTPTTCSSDDGCQSDSYCDATTHVCVPYPFGPRGPYNSMCVRLITGELFAPTIQCDWPLASEVAAGALPDPSSVQILSTPDVADFHFPGGAEVSAIHPSIVFASYAGLDGSCGQESGGGVLRIVDGRTCATTYTIDSPPVLGDSTPAIGDLDGDGRAEIVALGLDGGLVAFTFDAAAGTWKLLWHSHDGAGNPLTPAAGICMWTSPSIYDIDGDGKPEILLGGMVFDATGTLVDGSLGLYHDLSTGQFAVAADLDGDGTIELVMDDAYYTWNAASRAWRKVQSLAPSGSGYAAVGDFGTYAGSDPSKWNRAALDGQAEIAVVGSGVARIYDQAGVVVFQESLPGSTGGGPPTIGDFDADGRAELAAAGSDSYTIFDPDCTGTSPDPKTCASGRTDGVLWTQPSQDHSSNITGSSLFDFSGDGKEEAIYADECYVRVYDGATGDVLFSQPHSSCTWNENPVVADVQGSFRSRLLAPSNENCGIGCPPIDPTFPGLRCTTSADCPSALPCDSGLCRCAATADCGSAGLGGGFSCTAPPAGTPGSGNTCRASHGASNHGLRVYADVLDRWAASRHVWNQHTYAVTEIGDDGTVTPTAMWKRNWTVAGLNNFRAQVQGTVAPDSAPDLTSRPASRLPCNPDGSMTLTAQVCDRGTAPVGDGLDVAFFDGDPKAGGTLICVAATGSLLMPGDCTTASCTWKPGPGGRAHSVYVVADDDGTGKAQYVECDSANNETILQGVSCTQ